jgi:hypothetical protein
MLEKITSFITGIVLAIGGFFAPTPEQPVVIQEPEVENFGGFSPVAGNTYRLKSSLGSADTSITLSSFTEPITGNKITMTTLNSDIGYATIDPQSSTRKEFVSFTGVTQNSDGSAMLTGVSRGLGFQYPFTASSTLRKSHPGQSILILSDSPQLFNEYARIRSNETITGQWTFSTFPITPSTSPATATTSGNVELATGGEAASSTITGDTSILALHTGISTSSAPSSGNVVVVTGDDGNIDTSFLGNIGEVNFIATTTGTLGSSTIKVFSSTGSSTYSKPAFLKHIIVEIIAAGGGGGPTSGGSAGDAGNGGGAGGYVKKFILGSALASTTKVYTGVGGSESSNGTYSLFGGIATSTGGTGGSGSFWGAGGTGSGGDLNGVGASGGAEGYSASLPGSGGTGMYGYGYGGRGGYYNGIGGASGGNGVVIITEYF